MSLNRRGFLGALAGLPILKHLVPAVEDPEDPEFDFEELYLDVDDDALQRSRDLSDFNDFCSGQGPAYVTGPTNLFNDAMREVYP